MQVTHSPTLIEAEALTLTSTATEARIDSRILARNMGVQPRASIALIERYTDKFKGYGLLTFKKAVMQRKGQPERYALLNEDQAFFLLSLSRNNDRVVELKYRLVRAFRDARRAADVRQTEYLPEYHRLHDAIKMAAAGSPNERWLHVNANKALNQLAGLKPGQRATAGPLEQSLMAVGAALAANAVLESGDGHGIQQRIKAAFEPLTGVLALPEVPHEK